MSETTSSKMKEDREAAAHETAHLYDVLHQLTEDHAALTRLLARSRRGTASSTLPKFLHRRWPFGQTPQYHALKRDYETISWSPLFDPDWYVKAYRNVEEKGEDPIHHFLKFSNEYCLSPGPYFDAKAYLDAHPEVKQSGENPLLHYIRIGATENYSLGRTLFGMSTIDAKSEMIAKGIFTTQQSELSHKSAASRIAAFPHRPLISVIMPIYNTPVQWLRRAVESLQEQYYADWELCAVDDCSPADDQRRLLRELAATDPRIRPQAMEQNGGISAASNKALEMAEGEYVALLDHDDELTPDALFRIVEALNKYPEADFVYSDECKVDDTPEKKLFDFAFKPDWSPEIMFNGMLTGHLTVYRTQPLRNLGGFRSEYDFSQDYDLALRMGTTARRVVHVERILYLWRAIPGSAASDGKDFARASNVAALADHLRRLDVAGQVIALEHANCVRVTSPARAIAVSIVIPSDSEENISNVLNSLKAGTSYPNYEVLVVCNGPLADRLARAFQSWPNAVFVKYDQVYNFSDKCNAGADRAKGDVVIFYNDDVFPKQQDWIERLIEYLAVPGVGGVSPKLLYSNGTIQYAGMISGTPGLCGTAYHKVPYDATDRFLSMHNYVRNVSILSGACCALRKDVFWEVGGFDPINTPDGHSDMDLSYKLIEAGYRCVYTPYSLLTHVGNHSWGAKKSKYKADIYVLRRWNRQVSNDPYFTPSMKKVLYHDFDFRYRIHAEHLDPGKTFVGPDILLVSHELSLTGAPRMLYYAARVLREAGAFPVVVAPMDGPLRDELLTAGIAVIVDGSVGRNHFLFERFARNFDLVVVNTVALVEVARQLSKIETLRTVWWLHEAQWLSSALGDLQGVCLDRIHFACVSDYAKSFLPPTLDVEVLHNGIPDQVVERADTPAHQALTFLMSGTIEPRKAQDLLVDAIALLPDDIGRECRFLITGKLWEHFEGYWRTVEPRIGKLPDVSYLGLLNHDEQLRLIASCDVLVCPSRDEAFSLIVLEAAMLSKPTILSDHVGSADLFDDGSCFVFQSGSAQGLANSLIAAFRRRDELKGMGLEARRIFERALTIESFGKNFLAMVSTQIRESTASHGSNLPTGEPSPRTRLLA